MKLAVPEDMSHPNGSGYERESTIIDLTESAVVMTSGLQAGQSVELAFRTVSSPRAEREFIMALFHLEVGAS